LDDYTPWTSIIEGTSAEIKFTIKDQDGNGVQPTTLNFYLYDYKTEKVINSRTNVSITPVATYVTSGGVFTWALTAADNVFYNANLRQEIHIAKFIATWSSGTKTAKFFVPFYLRRDSEPA
jgi:hypothetical protein